MQESSDSTILSRWGLYAASAREDLERLGWDDEDDSEVLWALSRAAHPDCALRLLSRLADALDSDTGEDPCRETASLMRAAGSADSTPLPPQGWRALKERISTDTTLRGRLFGVLGASPALGDHCVANPSSWQLLLPTKEDEPQGQSKRTVQPLPTREELENELLAIVSARADTDPEQGEHQLHALRCTYRHWQLRLAAWDLAATVEDEPVLSLMEVGGHLSDMADAVLAAGLVWASAKYQDSDTERTAIAVIAMGKHGARELNYVSDVDVIFVAEPVGQISDRIVTELMRVCSTLGFVVDAGLRPEGRHGALTRTVESHQKYYTTWAKTWEFQALLKARFAVGDSVMGRRWMDAIEPLVWHAARRENFVEDVRSMRRKVEESAPVPLREREIKIGRGSLRDVEFAVQLLQLVHGEYDENIRMSATLPALAALGARGYISRDDAANMAASYEFLRLLEHRLQLRQLQRTHVLPDNSDEEAMLWLARAAHIRPDGDHDAAGMLRDELQRERQRILRLHSKFFYQPLLDAVAQRRHLGEHNVGAGNQLRALGYEHPESAITHLRALSTGDSRAHRIHSLLLPTMLEWLSDTPDPDGGLLSYRKISESFTDQPWYLRSLRDETSTAQRLMRILGCSRFVPELLLRAPEVLLLYSDSPQGPGLTVTTPKDVAQSLLASSAQHSDMHLSIKAARAARRYELARLASADLLGLLSTEQICHALSSVWVAVIEASLAAVISTSQETTENTPAVMAIIGMGRLGGSELGYGSDADVMFVCEPRRGYSEHQAIKWATGVAERLRTSLAAPTIEPRLHVDVDLRPEGRNGPLVSTVAAFERYYRTRAQSWEAQALLRARIVAGDAGLGEKFLQLVTAQRYPKGGIKEDDVREIRRIKARVDAERLPRGGDPTRNTKLGRGGLADVEWAVQLIQLQHAQEIPALQCTSTLEALSAIAHHGILSVTEVEQLKQAWLLATRARNSLVLVTGKTADQLPGPGRALSTVAFASGWKNWEDSGEYLDHYLRVTRRAHRVVKRVLEGTSTQD